MCFFFICLFGTLDHCKSDLVAQQTHWKVFLTIHLRSRPRLSNGCCFSRYDTLRARFILLIEDAHSSIFAQIFVLALSVSFETICSSLRFFIFSFQVLNKPSVAHQSSRWIGCLMHVFLVWEGGCYRIV